MVRLKPIILFCCAFLLYATCDEPEGTPTTTSRFKTREIVIGLSALPPQYFSYTAVSGAGIVVVINKEDPAQPDVQLEPMYVEKYDTDGTRVWSKLFPSEFGIIGRSIVTTSEGDILVAASLQKSATFGDDNIAIIRLTADGEEIWTRVFPAGFFDLPIQIIELSNKNILVDFLMSEESYLMLLDPDGNEISRISKAGLGCANGERIAAAEDGGFTIGSPNPAKLAIDGAVQFCQPIYVFSCTEPIYRSAFVKPVSANSYAMLGSMARIISDGCTTLAYSDLLISVLDGNGSALSNRTIDLEGKDYPKGMDVTQDAILLLSDGQSGDDFFDQKIYLMKVGHDLSEIWRERLNYSNAGYNQAITVNAITENQYAIMVSTRNVSLIKNEIKLVILTEQD